MSKKFNGHRCERRNLTDLVLGTGPTGKKRAKPKAKKRPKNYSTEPAANRMDMGGPARQQLRGNEVNYLLNNYLSGGYKTHEYVPNQTNPLHFRVRPEVAYPVQPQGTEVMAPSSTAVAMPGMPQPVVNQNMIPDVVYRHPTKQQEQAVKEYEQQQLAAELAEFRRRMESGEESLEEDILELFPYLSTIFGANDAMRAINDLRENGVIDNPAVYDDLADIVAAAPIGGWLGKGSKVKLARMRYAGDGLVDAGDVAKVGRQVHNTVKGIGFGLDRTEDERGINNRYGGVPKAQLGLATQGIPGVGGIFDTLDRYANPPAIPADMPNSAASAFNDFYMNASPGKRIALHERMSANPNAYPYVRQMNHGLDVALGTNAISEQMYQDTFDSRTRDDAYAQYGNQFQQGMAPTVRDRSYEPEYQINMGSQEPGDPSDPNFTQANTRAPFDPSGLLKFAGRLQKKNMLTGLSPSQIPGAVADFNKKMGQLNLAGSAMGSLGSFLNQQAQGEAGPMDQYRYNAPDGTMASAGDILSGAGRFAQFGPLGMAGGALYGAIAGKRRREKAAEDWQTAFEERNDAIAAGNVQAAYSGADSAYSGYADEGNFYMTMGGRPDYETEKNEVILASPGDKPIAMTGNSYKQLSTNLFKGRGPSHEQGGIPTKGATEPFVDSGGNYQDSPYVFSDAYKIDPTEFLSMLS